MFFKTDWTGFCGFPGGGGGDVPTNGPCALAKSLAWAVRHQLPLQEAVLTLLPKGRPPGFHGGETRGGCNRWDAGLRLVYLDLCAGFSLADALGANLRHHLPAYFIAAVREAEQKGRLAEVLPPFAERLNYASNLGRLFRMRLLFPCMELLVILLVFLLGMEFLAPKFMRIYAELAEGSAVGAAMGVRMVLDILFRLGVVVVPVLGLFYLLRRVNFHVGVVAELLPVLGGYYRKLAALDFYGCAASYLAVGSDIAAAAAHARDACPSPWLKRRLEPFVTAVRAGRPLAETLDLLPFSSDLERWIVHESAAQGRLGEGFDNAQRLLRQRLAGSAHWHSIVLELLMLGFNTAVVGSVASAMFWGMRTIIFHVGA